MKAFILGFLSFPALCVAIYAVVRIASILYFATRDTRSQYRAGLKPRYSRLHWAWLIPAVWVCEFGNQVKAWWGGYDTRISV